MYGTHCFMWRYFKLYEIGMHTSIHTYVHAYLASIFSKTGTNAARLKMICIVYNTCIDKCHVKCASRGIDGTLEKIRFDSIIRRCCLMETGHISKPYYLFICDADAKRKSGFFLYTFLNQLNSAKHQRNIYAIQFSFYIDVDPVL